MLCSPKTICEKTFGFVNAQVMGTVMLNQNVGFCLINDAKCFLQIVKTTKDKNDQNMFLAAIAALQVAMSVGLSVGP